MDKDIKDFVDTRATDDNIKVKKSFFARVARVFRRYALWLLLAGILALIASAYMYGRYSVYKAYPELYKTEQAQSILKKVGNLMLLPNGVPKIAVINNVESIKKQQPFLENAKDGDVLIIYTNASEVIVYRPSVNRLIAVGPLNSNRKVVEKQNTKKTDLSHTNTLDTITTTKYATTTNK